MSQVALRAPQRACTHGELASLAAVGAGINLNLPVVGRVLRGLGAFFIRRKFTGLPDSSLYREVLAGAPPPGHQAWFTERKRTSRNQQVVLCNWRVSNQPSCWLHRVYSGPEAPDIAVYPMAPVPLSVGLGLTQADPKPYSHARAAYIRAVLEEGLPMEVFIEGGRSRDGRITLPRLGILSFVVDAFLDGSMGKA